MTGHSTAQHLRDAIAAATIATTGDEDAIWAELRRQMAESSRLALTGSGGDRTAEFETSRAMFIDDCRDAPDLMADRFAALVLEIRRRLAASAYVAALLALPDRPTLAEVALRVATREEDS